MTVDASTLVTICARGGSKGVPDKNVRDLDGQPLITHTIRQAKQWDRTTDLVVSTDSDGISMVAEDAGARVPFRRPDELATDEAAKLPVIQHAHEQMESITGRTYDYVVDLDATAPLRLVADIENCFQRVHGTEATNAYTVTEADKNPYFNMVELDENGYASLSKSLDDEVVRRQDAPSVYEMNASVYTYERSYLADADSTHGDRTGVAEMPPERSVDIDRPIDFALVKFLVEEWGVDFD
ncbi:MULTISPECIES: acylneuraminate cytidylyltransferase family protein [Halomicrobium]|uniref:N-acylneuraminate cytidylyltransferase n=2 Tax=Halomicrobium mukohataei TaxID=57705 RepID=C7P3B2_HALMD|nr:MULTISPECIES: acylneuraminate cytidylyltransferase family protein [Halomicrobium]ACV47584.1 N-acylneuraminate cytidylyltransferase [Halomicrobium mukohataei DSM 12286]QCD66047.1 acylneuraminate cytidylyltransferase family protein [Halomicrobium mukohataei]QFR20852.1 flagellar modification protein B [Halomicrobium sp. ZPS1]